MLKSSGFLVHTGSHARLAQTLLHTIDVLLALTCAQVELMQLFGAETARCPPVALSDARHYYPTARAWGNLPGHVWTDQFESILNSQSHFESKRSRLRERTRRRARPRLLHDTSNQYKRDERDVTVKCGVFGDVSCQQAGDREIDVLTL